MKIKIKKFMELSDVSFETPAKIEAPHDGGKSTIFRAVLFAVTGKDIDGKEFDGKIYPKNSTMLSDLAVEVEIEQSGVVFNKKATGSEKRQKGSDEVELQRSVTAVYSIDYRVVGKSEYDAKIMEVFGNFHLFCNPDYFRNLKKEDKRVIFASLVKIDKASYFNGLADKKTMSGKISAQKDLISSTNSKLEELSKVQEPEKNEVVDYDSQLAELRKQRENAEPKFTDLQITGNNHTLATIEAAERATFIPTALISLLPEPEKPVLIDVDALKKQLEKVQLSEPDTDFIDTQIARMKVKISQIKSLALQIENYDENVKQAKCTLCQICTAPDCQFKKVEVTPIEELKNELSKYMSLSDAEKSIENFESNKINYLRDFEVNKNETIASVERAISDSIKRNSDSTEIFNLRSTDTQTKNAGIVEKNIEIEKRNLTGKANFETEKAQKIAELKKILHTLPAFDYSEIDIQIAAFEELQKEHQTNIDRYNELNGAYIYAQSRIVVLTDELKQLKEALYSFERELVKIEKAENDYYNDFENLINAEMPENIKVSLFKKNLSNDDYSECFEIEFNGSIYAGNGKTIAFYIWLCAWFQSKFGKDLPIFIDEAIILNEKLYTDVKNTVILMRNDNLKTLKIN